MNLGWKAAAGVPALFFVFVGLAWWLAPEFAAARFGMTMQSGVGLSTQIGDLASFFFTLGGCWLVGLVSGDRVWLYPSIMLLTLAIVGRFIAWLFHDAALAVGMMATEAIIVFLLFLLFRKLTDRPA